MITTLASEPLWSANRPGFRFTDHERGTAEFTRTLKDTSYRLEPHIAEIVQFASGGGA